MKILVLKNEQIIRLKTKGIIELMKSFGMNHKNYMYKPCGLIFSEITAEEL